MIKEITSEVNTPLVYFSATITDSILPLKRFAKLCLSAVKSGLLLLKLFIKRPAGLSSKMNALHKLFTVAAGALVMLATQLNLVSLQAVSIYDGIYLEPPNCFNGRVYTNGNRKADSVIVLRPMPKNVLWVRHNSSKGTGIAQRQILSHTPTSQGPAITIESPT